MQRRVAGSPFLFRSTAVRGSKYPEETVETGRSRRIRAVHGADTASPDIRVRGLLDIGRGIKNL